MSGTYIGDGGLLSPTKRARLTAEEEVEQLRSEKATLNTQLEALEAQLVFFQRPPATLDDFSLGPSRHAHKISRLPSGVAVRIAGDELAAMRAIFSLFDKGNNNHVSAADLQELHRKLGEPITDDEAKEAVAIIGRGNDFVTFEDFVLYWDGTHPSQRAIEPLTSLPADMHAAPADALAAAAAAASGTAGAAAAQTFVPPLTSPVVRAMSLSGDALQLERARKRQWYQQRFKFLKCKVANPAVGRIYAVPQGPCPSLEYRVRFFYDDETTGAAVQVSPWHDVPWRNPDRTYNMIVEIPKWSRRKFEIATGEAFNPIKQDVKNGKLREYGWGDMLFNYGAIPQTYESPSVIHPDTGKIGDNDPIDVVDIGTKMWTTGSIVRVKVLGVLAMIDAGETDWKLIGINVEDPIAPLLHDVDDIRVHMPGAVEALHRWLKFYKSPAINEFAYGGEPRGRAFAEELVEETHEAWEQLIAERGRSAVVSKDE